MKKPGVSDDLIAFAAALDAVGIKPDDVVEEQDGQAASRPRVPRLTTYQQRPRFSSIEQYIGFDASVV